MAYKDTRDLSDKLLEHRKWNTLELEIGSAADDIAAQLICALKALTGSTVDETKFVSALSQACKSNDPQLMEGLVRLAVLCSNETPNRFKALFPAYLIQEELAQVENDKMRWAGFGRLSARLVTIEALVKVLVRGTGGDTVRKHFARWVREKGGFETISEISGASNVPNRFIYSVSLRLAQGADTNRRGHSATDMIKSKLREYGFTPELGNTNTSDVAVSELVADYNGPRKFDTVVWNAKGEVVLVCQSQMYSSDVGSIQGKTVEEDYLALRGLRKTWPELTVLTNTEGFGCHTTMLSRLKHVLNSEIDGFIQLRTLDLKLRSILRQVKCVSLLDFEKVLFLREGCELSESELLQKLAHEASFDHEELKCALARYIDHGMLTRHGDIVAPLPLRLPLIAYYSFLDTVSIAASELNSLAGGVIEVGGLERECGIAIGDFRSNFDDICARLVSHGGGREELEALVKESQVFEGSAV